MKLIVAVDEQWGIGKNGDLLDHIPEDLAYFKEKTLGHVVMMGQVTFESLPNQKPLPNRTNVVLSWDENFSLANNEGCEGVIICRSMEDFLEKVKTDWQDREIFFIGGESIYRMGVEMCDTAYITKIGKTYDADRFIPNLDKLDNWEIVKENKVVSQKGLELNFIEYRKTI